MREICHRMQEREENKQTNKHEALAPLPIVSLSLGLGYVKLKSCYVYASIIAMKGMHCYLGNLSNSKGKNTINNPTTEKSKEEN